MTKKLERLMLEDFLNLFCGRKLGDGIARTVFVSEMDPSRVIKIEKEAGHWQNLAEWKVWSDAEDTPLEKYLAPVHHISQNGRVLIQSRVWPLPTEAEAKAAGSKILEGIKLPEVLTDLKPDNYGIFERRIVCCDYGSCLAINHAAMTSKLRKVDWRFDD